ncbi:MAG: methionine--tRNA ligase subunit beta [Promethearchaeati archaeon SRVP18_Atabeyarchaeia-1]
MSQVVPITEFQKLDIRVGKVTKAERIASSKKLVKLKVDIGNETREIVAGVAEFYSPEDLQDKNLIILTNLEPRKVMGVQSQGMILAADVSGRPYVIFAEPSIPPGAKVR